VFQKALANESRVKESRNLQNPNEKVKHHVHLLNYESDKLDDCGEDVYVVEFTRTSKDTPHTCSSLKSIHKNW
jgi:cell division protein FtsB